MLAYGQGDESDANRINTLASFAPARAAGVELDLRQLYGRTLTLRDVDAFLDVFQVGDDGERHDHE